jgi:3-deoxy-D-manno-octulosonic-acid transferase
MSDPTLPPARSAGASRGLDLLYAAAAVLLTPYFLYRRWVLGKRSAPYAARMARTVPESTAGKRVIWLHAVSVGEITAAEPLVKQLTSAFPDAGLRISVTTVTGHAVAVKKYGAERVVFYPHDFSEVVKRFLNRIRPSVAVLMELEVWPNMTAELAARGIPIVVVNGRITARSAPRYKRFWFLAGPAFLRVNRWLVQSDEYAERLRTLGVAPERIAVSGNIKYDAIDTAPPDARVRDALRAELGFASGAPVLLGGSTHPTEETALLAAYRTLRSSSQPALRLVLVPRHPERIPAVESEIRAAGLTCVRRSQMRPGTVPPADAVVLVDTVGELKRLYAAADVAFVGGSLIPHGGQNIMEPCGLGVPSLHGPHMHNFAEAMEILNSCRGAVEVTRESLCGAVETLLAQPQEAKAMALRARHAFIERQGAVRRAVEYIADLMK